VFSSRNTSTPNFLAFANSFSAALRAGRFAAPSVLGEKKGVKWLGAANLPARKAAEKEFANAKKFGVEVFRDENTGYLIYICETGSIAVVAKK
jgi:hypothetical protein